ncbi:MAG TPA: multicopper oxidase domain-containing protein [Caulobacteraceae bacterium]|nr:multicopper oxidase domain-containing protein [Caulobacteraceae bacterium]
MKRIAVLLAVAVAVAVAGPAVASPGHPHDHGASAAVYGQPGDPAQVTRTVEVVATDNAFDRPGIRVRAGETVRFVLLNRGETVHELTVGDAAAQQSHRALMAEVTDEDLAAGAHAHPNAVTAAPGERAELVWRFAGPGRFEFACNVLGHAEQGMAGVLTVD